MPYIARVISRHTFTLSAGMLLVGVVLPPPSAAQEFPVNSRVVVIRDGAAIVSGSEAVDTVDRGEILNVANTNASWVLVRRGHSGWIAKQDLIALENAQQHFSRKIAQNPHDAGARAARGNLRVDGRLWDAALVDATDALRQNPQLLRAWLVRSAAARGQKRFAQALEDAQQAIRLDPTLPDGFVAAGHALHDQGQVTRAVAQYSAALERDPTNARIYLVRGQCRLVSLQPQQYELAVTDFDAAVDGAQYDPACQREARLARGQAYLKQGKIDQAVAEFGEMISQNQYDIRALIGRGTAYGYERQYILAVPDLDTAVWLNPQISMGYLARAEFRTRVGKLDAALTDVADALRLEPGSAVAYRIRGEALGKQQKWDAALAAFGQALALEPNNAAIYLSRALAYEGNSNAAQAAADRRQANELDSDAEESLAAADDNESASAKRPQLLERK